jgi:hypothetical protein
LRESNLYLHGSKVALAMNEVPRDEVAEAGFGAYPAIEALAFAVDALRTWLNGHGEYSDRADPRKGEQRGPGESDRRKKKRDPRQGWGAGLHDALDSSLVLSAFFEDAFRVSRSRMSKG